MGTTFNLGKGCYAALLGFAAIAAPLAANAEDTPTYTLKTGNWIVEDGRVKARSGTKLPPIICVSAGFNTAPVKTFSDALLGRTDCFNETTETTRGSDTYYRVEFACPVVFGTNGITLPLSGTHDFIVTGDGEAYSLIETSLEGDPSSTGRVKSTSYSIVASRVGDC